MKCPKCGFVSYSGLTECKRCGHSFASEARKKSRFFSLFSSSPDSLLASSASGSEPTAPIIHKPGGSSLEPLAGPTESPRDVEGVNPDSAPLTDLVATQRPVAADRPEAASDAPASQPQVDIADRVENFRRRRARLRGFDPDSSLALEFGNNEEPDEEAAASMGAHVVEFSPQPKAEEAGLELPPLGSIAPFTDMLEKDSEPDLLDSVAVAPGDLEIKPAEAGPVEVVLDSSPAPQASPEEFHVVLPLAPVGRRFAAGLADLGILLIGAGLFSLIFWFAGGHISLVPLNLAVLVFISTFFATVYFGAFTALAGATPGLLLVGLEIRNWEGHFPTLRESLWRAFGYLVSAAALMLGFVWAFVDSESLCWHDHISSTFVTTRKAD